MVGCILEVVECGLKMVAYKRHGGQIYHDQHFHTDDTLLPSIDEGVIQEDVGASFIQEVLQFILVDFMDFIIILLYRWF